jgi:hypothetical protein
MTKRKYSPAFYREMARRRGVTVNKAIRGGWYVMLAGAPWSKVLYCSHEWEKVVAFMRGLPVIVGKDEL